MSEIRGPCPHHEGNTRGSDSYSWNTYKNRGYCQSCGLKTWVGDGGDLMGKHGEHGKAFLIRDGGPEITPRKPHKGQGDTMTTPKVGGHYADFRGIHKSVREFYGVLSYETDTTTEQHYKYPSGGLKIRTEPGKKFTAKNLHLDELFGMNLFPAGCSKMITITEGEEDSMAAYQMLKGGSYINPVVGLPGATPSPKLWEKCKGYLDSFEKIIVSADQDEPGQKVVETMFDLFPGKVFTMDHGRHKDANDFLVAGDGAAYKNAWWKAKKFSPAGFTASAEDWLKALSDEDPYEHVNTPFKSYNKVGRGLVKGGITVIKAPPGSGKCLGKDTPVLMWNGAVKMSQDVVVGDLLMGDDSTPREVLGTTKGIDKLYRITPNKGEPWVCNSQHVLSLYHNTKKKVFDIGLQDYLVEKSDFTHHAKQYRAKVTHFEADVILPIDPYLYGVYLGDGSKVKAELHLGHKKDKVREVVKQKITDMGLNYTETFISDKNCYNIRISNGYKPHPFLRVDIDLVEDYKRASWEDRRQFLAGLLDTDGFSYVGGFDFVQKDKRIADAVVFVARSLGLAAYIKPCEKSIKSTGFTGDYYRVSISGDTKVIPTLRHSQAARKINKNVLNTGFKVEEIGRGEYFGFELDGNHRFLLGDFTVTHNSSLLRCLQHHLVTKEGCKVACLMMEEVKSITGRAMATYQLGKNVMTKEDAEWNGVDEDDVAKALLEVVGDDKFVSFDINPQDPIEDTLRQCNHAIAVYGADYIWIDHLQRLAYLSGTDNATANLTSLGVKLTELAKRKNVGIIAISHVNEDGATKYAKAIEEEAIVIIELKRDRFAEDMDGRNTSYLTITKNRPFGSTGSAGALSYDPDTTILKEKEGPKEPNVLRSNNNDIPF